MPQELAFVGSNISSRGKGILKEINTLLCIDRMRVEFFIHFLRGDRKFLVVFSRSEQEQAEKFKDV